MMLKRIALVAFALLCVARTTAASSVTLQPGPYEAKYENFESFFNPIAPGSNIPNLASPCTTVAVGCVNEGVFIITQVFPFPASLNSPWFNTSSSAQITGIFTGVTVSSVTPNTTGFNIESTGGTLSIYLNDGSHPLYDGSIANATDGTLMVQFNFVPGIVPSAPTVTVSGQATAITNPLSGQAFGYLDVIPGSGAWASFFDGNAVPAQVGVPAGVDALEQSNFNTQSGNPSPAAGLAPWQLVSHDPVTGTIIPEPGSLMLLGAGLLGFGRSFKRRFSKLS